MAQDRPRPTGWPLFGRDGQGAINRLFALIVMFWEAYGGSDGGCGADDEVVDGIHVGDFPRGVLTSEAFFAVRRSCV